METIAPASLGTIEARVVAGSYQLGDLRLRINPRKTCTLTRGDTLSHITKILYLMTLSRFIAIIMVGQDFQYDQGKQALRRRRS
jgi:hypothetical protein